MVGRTAIFAGALMIGLAASQVPEFAQQYRQRMAGAIDELATVITHFDEDARRSGYDREAALTTMAANETLLVRDQAASMRRAIGRHERLVHSRQAMQEAAEVGRLVVLGRTVDRDLAQATFDDFEPAIPATMESVSIAGGSFLAAYLLLHGLGYLVRPRRRRARLRRRARPGVTGWTEEAPY